MVMDNLTIGFLKHYAGYCTNMVNDMDNTSRLEAMGIDKLCLIALRTVRAGMILSTHEEVVYNINEQQEYYTASNQPRVLNDYLNNRTPNSSSIKELRHEIDFFRYQLDSLIKSSTFTATPLAIDLFAAMPVNIDIAPSI